MGWSELSGAGDVVSWGNGHGTEGPDPRNQVRFHVDNFQPLCV
jgi:hypothetical protein